MLHIITFIFFNCYNIKIIYFHRYQLQNRFAPEWSTFPNANSFTEISHPGTASWTTTEASRLPISDCLTRSTCRITTEVMNPTRSRSVGCRSSRSCTTSIRWSRTFGHSEFSCKLTLSFNSGADYVIDPDSV